MNLSSGNKSSISNGATRFKTLAISAFLVALCTTVDEAYAKTSGFDEWFIGPRVGLTNGVGFVRVEAQHLSFGFFAGYAPLVGGSVGINYYFNDWGNSWVVGPFFSYVEETDEKIMTIGLSGGYRWRFDSGWEIALGAGAGYARDTENSGGREMWLIGPTLTVGYSWFFE